MGNVSKCLPRTYIEENLEKMLVVNGEEGINGFRDKAKEIAKQLNMTEEFETLNDNWSFAFYQTLRNTFLWQWISQQLCRRPRLFDQERVKLFETLFKALHNEPFPKYGRAECFTASFRNFAFFESYFSNYI